MCKKKFSIKEIKIKQEKEIKEELKYYIFFPLYIFKTL